MTKTDVDTNNAEFCAALGDQDMDRLMRFYDPDITLLIPGVPPIRGHEGVRAYYGNVFAAGVTGAEMRTLQLEEVGDTLVEVGEYTMGLEPPGADAFEDAGKYFVIHRRQADGGWAMWIDMFHSDTAAA